MRLLSMVVKGNFHCLPFFIYLHHQYWFFSFFILFFNADNEMPSRLKPKDAACYWDEKNKRNVITEIYEEVLALRLLKSYESFFYFFLPFFISFLLFVCESVDNSKHPQNVNLMLESIYISFLLTKEMKSDSWIVTTILLNVHTW